MKELTIDALKENLDTVLQFIDGELEGIECPVKIQFQIDVAVEEIYINIASYAYGDSIGKATIEMEVEDDPKTLAIRFIDSGVPYDPLKKPDPDITLSADERRIGGLGIFMVKKSMDSMEYAHQDGKNILVIKKALE